MILMKFLGRNVICEMKINEGRKEGGRGSPEERLLLSFSFAGWGTIQTPIPISKLIPITITITITITIIKTIRPESLDGII